MHCNVTQKRHKEHYAQDVKELVSTSTGASHFIITKRTWIEIVDVVHSYEF